MSPAEGIEKETMQVTIEEADAANKDSQDLSVALSNGLLFFLCVSIQ